MRTLVLRGGTRVAVVEEEWSDAFGVVTHGWIQLELRDGEPGPVLGRDAGFWLQGTGVRALRNPGRRTARVRIVTPPGSGRTTEESMEENMERVAGRRSVLGFVGGGLAATVGAMVATTLAAVLARAVGVGFEVPEGGETIPVAGVAVVTGFFSLVGVGIAAALLRWSGRPVVRWVWTAGVLTAVSLVPPFLVGADVATVAALVGLHLVAAGVMIPALAWSLRAGERGR